MITKNKKRVCGYKDCSTDISQRRKTALFCCREHKVKERVRSQATSRARKRLYNERHGIERKTIKRSVKETGIPPDGIELVYENYKEPLRKIPKGFGFMGTIAQTNDRQRIQCHICGNLYSSLGGHVRSHKLSAEQYKTRFGLGVTTALVAEKVRDSYVVGKKYLAKPGELLPSLQEYNRKIQLGLVKHPGNGNKAKGGWTLERRNREGMCPDQLLQKITDLAGILGRTPSNDEFRNHYNDRYILAIVNAFGSWVNAVKRLKRTPVGELRSPSNERLLEQLIEFNDKHGRPPMTSDFKRGLLPPRAMYWRRFGSLNNARVEAGLPAIIPLVYNKYIEIPPDEYLAYKNGKKVGTVRQLDIELTKEAR